MINSISNQFAYLSNINYEKEVCPDVKIKIVQSNRNVTPSGLLQRRSFLAKFGETHRKQNIFYLATSSLKDASIDICIDTCLSCVK